jgi:hypothetical protein
LTEIGIHYVSERVIITRFPSESIEHMGRPVDVISRYVLTPFKPTLAT